MALSVSSGALAKPVIPSPDALYDEIMGTIEPELLTVNLPNLDTLFAADTPAEKMKRGERYNKAFLAYATALQAYSGKMMENIRRYFLQSLHALEEQDNENNTTLQSIDAHFSIL